MNTRVNLKTVATMPLCILLVLIIGPLFIAETCLALMTEALEWIVNKLCDIGTRALDFADR